MPTCPPLCCQIYLLPDAAGVPGRMQWSMVTQVIQTKDEREADKGVKLMNMMEVQVSDDNQRAAREHAAAGRAQFGNF